jgi:hypothetical protein
MGSIDDIKRLVGHLESCAREAAGAQLNAASVETLLAVLCEHIELAEQSRVTSTSHPFQIVALATEAKQEEILAFSSDALIARAVFDEAVARLSDRKIRLKYCGRILAQAR